MSSVLHVIDRTCDETQLQVLNTLRAKLALDGARHAIVSIDPEMANRASAHLGEAVSTVPQRLWRIVNWVPQLAQRLREAGANILHAWGIEAATVCAARLPDVPLVLTLLEPNSTLTTATWLRSFPKEAAVVAGSQVIRARLIQAGMRGDRIVVVRGPADFGAVNQARQRNLRAEIFGDDGPVLLLSGPASRGGGQLYGVWAAAILAQIFPRLRVIAPYDSKERRRLLRFVERINMAPMLICPDDRLTWSELVTCADVFVMSPVKETCTEPLSLAMAGGLVVVGSAVRSVAEIIADRNNGLLCKPGKPKLLAARILAALEDAALRKQVTDTARGQAYDVFSVRGFVENYEHVYDNLLGGKPLDQNVSDRAMIA